MRYSKNLFKNSLNDFFCFAVLSATLLSATHAAAEPLSTAVIYQGFLTTVGGVTADGCYDFEVELFDQQTPGGSAVAGPTTFLGTDVDGGFFHLEIDYGAIYMGDQYYLEIRYRSCGGSDYSTLSPRQPLHAAPNAIYAMKAGTATTATSATQAAFADDADTLDGLDSSAFLPNNGGWVGDDLGVGISSPACRLQVVDQLQAPEDAAACIDFETTAGSISTYGIDVRAAELTLKGMQRGVQASVSASGATLQRGRALGRLASATAWDLKGEFIGATGVGRAENLNNLSSTAVSRSVGARFIGGSEDSLTLNINSVGSYFVGGTVNELLGTIDGPAVCSNGVAAVIGIDSSTGTAPSFAGHFQGDGYFSGHLAVGACDATNIITVAMGSTTDPIADAWTTYSSKRFKDDVNTLDGALAKVLQMRGVSFRWSTDGREDIGLIAEEVGEIVPEIVNYEANGTDAQGLDYTRLVPILIEAVKEQQVQIDQLLERLESPSSP